ncbi:MoxR-like ATPase [Methylophaga sulfidovorans]|uniref:MoxR-like ATPase n=2 Tax=Methylophaga sulfidovorans TaxID=45496 RepID=A0A1I3XER6_9GAMM|nr:MoxR-like ATPase [Methylophaga sulfidovorans]
MNNTLMKPMGIANAGDEMFQMIEQNVSSQLIGQKELVRSMMICLLCDGHLLIEGLPGLAKTTAAKTFASAFEGEFMRIQFTPDLLPSDLIGTDIFLQEQGRFEFRKGPLFNHIVLADEINRAPAKVQSALLEAMGEKQISIGLERHELPDLFMVMATQNPIEQEGTYRLPEAQLDRFLLHVNVGYPSHNEELQIIELDEKRHQPTSADKPLPHINQEAIFAARQRVKQTYIDEKLKHYIVSLINATREPQKYSDKLASWLHVGASPRATLGVVNVAKAIAYLEGDDYVTPSHIQEAVPNVLRHRIVEAFEAEAEGISRDQIIRHLLEVVALP